MWKFQRLQFWSNGDDYTLCMRMSSSCVTSDFLSQIFPWISSKKPKATGKILIFSSFQMPDSLNDSKNLSFRAM